MEQGASTVLNGTPAKGKRVDEIFEGLVKELRLGRVWDRPAVAEGLGRLGDTRAVDPLIDALGYAGGEVRRAAAWALGELGDARATAALVGVLGDRYTSVRYAAVEALGKLRDPQAVAGLLSALQHPEAEVRRLAAITLGQTGAPAGGAIEVLRRQARKDPLGHVRGACDAAIRQIERALRSAPAELEAAPAPGGRGTELEASGAPAGRGTELEAFALPPTPSDK